MMAMLNLNYKLNLSTASNLNLFDTIEGLKWVQKEIEKFGGNKSQVTLSGHSAGAIITGNVLMSQRSKGLISQAMMFSNSRKDMIMRDANQNYSRTFANLAGCSFYDTDWEDKDQVEEVIACLRRLKGIDFIHYQRKVDEYGFRMLPLTQDYGPDAFYQKDVSHFDLRKLNIPIMMGTTTHELMDGGSCIDKDKNGELSINWGKLETLCRYVLASLQFKDRILAVAACVDEYGFDINRVIYSEDDANLYMPLLREIQETNALGNKTFLYQFEYPDVVEILANPKNPTNDPSDYRHQHPMHSDDMAYIIGLKSKEFTPKHKYVQKVYSQMMVNFVKYSNPSDADIKFDEFDPKLNNYFVFDFHPNMTLKGMTNKYRKEAATFWQNTLIEKAGNYTVNYYESTLIETLNSANTLFDGINYPKVSYPPEFYRIETLVTSKKPSTSFIYIIYFIMMVIGAVLAVKCLTCCYKKFQHTKYEKLIV
uniref:Carboxylic ester hydrolase n=1 Tax=Rhabditophanes sp. KR3021 TaxID=114890 RepID=A0AC35TP17_9BILA